MRLSRRQRKILGIVGTGERTLDEIVEGLGRSLPKSNPRFYASRTIGKLVLRGELVRVKRGVFRKPFRKTT